MPYSANSELPATARALPKEAQDVFRRVFNEDHDKHGDETRAFATAWTAVKNGWTKTGENWIKKAYADGGLVTGPALAMDPRTYFQVRKDQPGAADVHVQGSGKDTKRKARLYAEVAARNMAAMAGTETKKFDRYVKAESVDQALGVVFGWAIVCKEDGKEYVDVQHNFIPENAMLNAATDFMENSRAGNEMHAGPDKGTYLFAFPLTEDIGKAMGIQCNRTGLMVGLKPPSDVLAKFVSGEYTGFSIEGYHLDLEQWAS